MLLDSGKAAAPGVTGKKRPAAWDLKGRLEEMEARFVTTNDRVTMLENQNTQLKDNVEEKETVVAKNSQELSGLKEENERLIKNGERLAKELETVKEEGDEKVFNLANVTVKKKSLKIICCFRR